MDFIKLIRSLEELLYEVVTWLVFYPRTMWRILAHPAATTRYSEDEQGDAPAEQYTDTLSPPLLLMLTILIAHGFELGMGAKMPETKTAVAKALFGSEQNLLMLRALLFSIFPLVAATTLLGRRKLVLDRTALRGPFFSQCYLAAPFALVASVAAATTGLAWPWAGPTAAGLALAGLGWYVWVQTAWFSMELDVGIARAFGIALWTVSKALVIGLGGLVLFARLLF